MQPSDLRMFLLLVGLLCLQLHLVSLAQENYAMLADSDGEKFHDSRSWFEADNEQGQGEGEEEDEQEEEKFYEAYSDELDIDEDDEEEACISSSREDCGGCCNKQGFDLPHWNRTMSQCFCYSSQGEKNICKNSESGHVCLECCLQKGFHEFDFTNQGDEPCYCSRPNYEAFS